jgi:acetate kinase
MRDDTSDARGAPDGASRAILTINGGSSTIKFAVFSAGPALRRTISGQIDRIGEDRATLTVRRADGSSTGPVPVDAPDHSRAAHHLADWLLKEGDPRRLAAIGHRIVHGGVHLIDHQPITPELIGELKANETLDPTHLPREIALIEILADRLPGMLQVACFDSAFHRDLPRVARLLPIPRPYIDSGIRRLGFHGLSYAYLLEELRRAAGDEAAAGRIVFAHLGSGASLAAVHEGRPVDTSMAFTPSAGLVMGTRPGDLDPGLLLYLMRAEARSPAQMDEFVGKRCGLLGVSQTTSDMRELLARRDADPRAADAVDLFCYQCRKWIGAFAAALGGLDTLVFSGGIGEHSDEVRRSVCEGLAFLNLRIDDERNRSHAARISTDDSAVAVRVIPTDEELTIARIVRTILEER